MKLLVFSVLLLFFSSISAQDKRIIVHDLFTKTVDTLDLVNYDKEIPSDQTNFFIGKYSDVISPLNLSVPEENIYPQANFTRRQRVGDLYDLTDFPIRTTIKLMRPHPRLGLIHKCSGTMVSPKHVLTACHCVMDMNQRADTLMYSSLLVAPIYNNGEYSTELKSSWVSKIYRPNNKGNFSEDFALLELSESIGIQTGWVGLGFNNDNEKLKEGIFYKFSYPGEPSVYDQVQYNGDTLYFGYGQINYFQPWSLGIESSFGVRGESGSSLLLVDNENTYVTYGVLTYSGDMRHSRIRNHTFYAFKSILDPYLNNASLIDDVLEVKLFYNMQTNKLIYSMMYENDIHIQIFNLNAQKLLEQKTNNTVFGEIDCQMLQKGMYIVRLTGEKLNQTYKFLKN